MGDDDEENSRAKTGPTAGWVCRKSSTFLVRSWPEIDQTNRLADLNKRNSLSDNGIGDKGAKALAKALETNTTLQLLGLNTNNIGSEGHTSLANALKQNRRLQTLPADVAQKFPLSEEDQALLQRSAPEGPERELSFTIWDYGGQQVFYALHHIFLTEKGLYLVVFDMREIIGKSEFETKLKPEDLELLASREDAIGNLRFWLNSIKLHAPNAPILLVGTYLDQVKDLLKVERHLAAHKICAPGTLVIPPNGLRFFPVDNSSVDPERAAELRRAIVSTAAAQPYVSERVPLAWLKIYEELVASSEPYWLYSDLIQRASSHGQSRNETDDLVAYFHGLGVVVHLRTSPALERIVVLDPQWLLDKLSCVIADDLHAEKMFYDPQLRASGHIEAYERMRSSSIASHSILEWLWRKQEVTFLRDFMIANMLLSEWRFDEDAEEDEFLVTGLLSGMTEPLETPHFEPGLSCILSFDKFFLPNGVFHRLVAQCAEYASRDDVAGDDEPMTPRQNNAQAIMSFGANDFLLTVRGNVIHICIDKRAVQPALVIKLLVSMFREQKDTIFRKLPWELLLVSPTSQVSISHGKLAKAHQAGKLKRRLRDPSGGRTAYVSEFDAFFREDLGALDGDGDGKQVSSPVPVSPLGPDEDTHVFISHVQATGGDLSDALRCKLENRGLKVWFDQAHEGNLNRAAMLAAVRRARTYVLVLTKGIFASEAVKDELRCAFEANKPIVPVHENETHRLSYATFSEYIATTPSFCSGIFL
ncbi:Leucine-rich repeat serine/threonine-protein kinase 2 [Hondaea fermentalgiana]|uniref:non-specific serine/threonine protein kinase n=1 Tax=Hondaea fermentalgiana TaxID=2315210 RepID=A0A2R5G8E9_9STRA|nr:Leucine-rich repeat serine/threonine-protein kinase 2 [Hondaea fermentalgiana]|eukprot:GBG24321.1 Leucine-rich repeat serine/threonine-protein kinase 2 [Hondaea fermentalgiana]